MCQLRIHDMHSVRVRLRSKIGFDWIFCDMIRPDVDVDYWLYGVDELDT